jgi:hypothetical protein
MIRLPNLPSLQPVALDTPGVRVAAAAAPAVALGALAESIAGVSTHFFDTAMRVQKLENARVASEKRNELAASYAQHQLDLETDPDPQSRMQKTAAFLAASKGQMSDASLPPAVQDDLAQHFDSFATQATIRQAADSSKLAQRRATLAMDTELQRAMDSGDPGAVHGVLDRVAATGTRLPEEVDEMRRKADYHVKYRAIQSMIESDPVESETQLKDPEFLTRNPELSPEAVNSLRKQAGHAANAARGDMWDNVLSASLDGKILSADELKTLDDSGTITPQQRASYLHAYHGPTPPAFDEATYADAWAAIQSYDPAQDPMQSHLAQLRGQLATLPLPKETLAQLRGQLTERLATPDTPKHRLAGDYAVLTKQYFQSGRFGGWFTMEDHDKDPSTEPRKVINSVDFSKALVTQRRFLDQWDGFMKTAPADMPPEDARKAYDAIFNKVVVEQTPIDIGVKPERPAPPPFNERVRKALGEPAAPPTAATTATTAEPVGLPKALAPLAPSFAEAGRLYGVDPRLLAAISMHETGNGTSSLFVKHNNAMGVATGVGNGYQSFTKPEVSILKMARILGSKSGPYAGANTIAGIASIYAPEGATNDPKKLNDQWPSAVAKYYRALGGDPSKSFRFTPQPLQVSAKKSTREEAREKYFETVKPSHIAQVNTGLAAVDEDYLDSLLENEDEP